MRTLMAALTLFLAASSARAEGSPALHQAIGKIAHLYWVRQGQPMGAAGNAVAAKNWNEASSFVHTQIVRRGGGSDSFLGEVGRLAADEVAARAHGTLPGANFERKLSMQIGLATRSAVRIPGAN